MFTDVPALAFLRGELKEFLVSKGTIEAVAA
jgi:hypothetical protein